LVIIEASPLFDSPLVFPLQRRRRELVIIEASPLFNSPLVFFSFKGDTGDWLSKKGFASLRHPVSLTSLKEKGDWLYKRGFASL